MGHTYPNVLVHCIFSTKNRSNSIPDDLREKLSMYFVGIGKDHDIRCFAPDGTANHAHLLIALPPTVPFAKAIQVLKANSPRWFGEHGFDFAWQEGITSNIKTNIMRSIHLRMSSCRCCASRTSRTTRNLCSDDAAERGVPGGTRALCASFPGTTVPGVHIPPLRGCGICEYRIL